MKRPALKRFDESRGAAKIWCKREEPGGRLLGISFFLFMPVVSFAAFVIEARQRVYSFLFVSSCFFPLFSSFPLFLLSRPF